MGSLIRYPPCCDKGVLLGWGTWDRPVRKIVSTGWLNGELGDLRGCGRIQGSGTSSLEMRENLEVTMNMVKSLLLGSAAGLVAVAGGAGARPPGKAQAVRNVE